MQFRRLLVLAQVIILAITSPAAEPPKPPTFALLQTWAGPDAASLGFTQEKLLAFLAARKANLAAARQPQWSAWMTGFGSSMGPNLKAWTLTRRVEAGDLSAFPALQGMITEHLVGISTPRSGLKDRVISNPPYIPGIQMPDAFRIDSKSIFWASFRKTLKEIPDRKLPTGLHALWSYGTDPDQKDLILELAALVEAHPTLGNPVGEPW